MPLRALKRPASGTVAQSVWFEKELDELDELLLEELELEEETFWLELLTALEEGALPRSRMPLARYQASPEFQNAGGVSSSSVKLSRRTSQMAMPTSVLSRIQRSCSPAVWLFQLSSVGTPMAN